MDAQTGTNHHGWLLGIRIKENSKSGTERGTRTLTMLPSPDFESGASTIPPPRLVVCHFKKLSFVAIQFGPWITMPIGLVMTSRASISEVL